MMRLLLTAMLFINHAYGQNKLVGTWRLIDFADLDTVTHHWNYQYGQHPIGYFTYSKNHIVTVNISRAGPLRITEDSAQHTCINLYSNVQENAIGYFGTYSVDFKQSVLIHHVQGGNVAWYIGTDQPRPFVLKGDTLIIGDNRTWKRVLVKAD